MLIEREDALKMFYFLQKSLCYLEEKSMTAAIGIYGHMGEVAVSLR